MRNNRRVSAAAALLVSFAAFVTVSALLSRVFPGGGGILGILVKLVPYLGGVFASLACAKLSLRFTYDPSAEEECCVFDGEKSDVYGNAAEKSAENGADEAKPKDFTWIYALFALFLLLSVNFVIGAFSPGTEPLSGAKLVLSAAVGVLIKPIAEELIFRRTYLEILLRRGNLPAWAAVAVQALLFAAIHRGAGALFALFAGLVLGCLYEKTAKGHGKRRGFYASLAVHAAYNFILYAAMAATQI